jgi:hypothetical protein
MSKICSFNYNNIISVTNNEWEENKRRKENALWECGDWWNSTGNQGSLSGKMTFVPR